MTDDGRTMAREAETARARVEKDYSRELVACEDLWRLAMAASSPWAGRRLDPERPTDALLAAIFARTTKTYWAAVDSARAGFGEQASMLNRSLFEDMIDAHWLTIEPALATQRYEEHLVHSQLLLADAVRAHPGFFEDLELPDMPEHRREALSKIFGRHGEKSWTGISVYERVYAIEHLWDSAEGKEVLHFFRRIAHRENNQQLHLSSMAMNHVVRAQDPDGLTLAIGPGPELLDRALFGSFWIYGQSLSLVIEHFELPILEHFEAVCLEGSSVFRRLSDAELSGVGRNELCPCDSGKKYKHCHGR